jgi:hypothetical protein
VQKKESILRICGNGKSLSNSNFDLDKQNVIYMVLNRHVLSDSYTTIKPRHYVLTDPHFFSYEEGINILLQIEEKTVWNMKLYIPFSKKTKKIIANIFNNNQYVKICYYNNLYFEGYKKIRFFLYNINLAMPRAQNVLAASIYIAICQGFRNIELYGVEHSWTKHLFVNELNKVCLFNPHFYDEEESIAKTWKEIHHEEATFFQALQMYALMFESYHFLREYADIKDCKIINCTKDSFIDAFEKCHKIN